MLEYIDYSIHYLEPVNLLIAHMRYIGNDYEGDMAEIGKSEHTKKWWKVSPVSEFGIDPNTLVSDEAQIPQSSLQLIPHLQARDAS